jgi:putative lipoic acid-binding regulatory protein
VQERKDKPLDAAAEEKSLEAATVLAFPTAFPIKIMGRRESGFTTAVIEIVKRHAPDFQPGTLESRPSREGKYVSLTATVNATSREQLDALYQDLCDHPGVVMVL